MGGVKKSRKSNRQSWSDLSVDIINLIVEGLDYLDQIRCRALCKSWRSNIFGIRYPDKLPWVMRFIRHKEEDDVATNGARICHLYDPFNKRKFTIENQDWEIFVGARVGASKHGWVLLSNTISRITSFFFYTPFTNTIVKLPKQSAMTFPAPFFWAKLMVPSAMTFSAPPDSFDCVVFLLYLDLIERNLCVYTCKPGDKTWTVLFVNDCCRYGSLEHAAYVDGVLYSSFLNGVMGAFNVAQREWKVHSYPPTKIFRRSRYLIESHDGNLLMPYFDYDESGCPQAHIHKLDRLHMNWVEVESLDDESVFIGPSCISIPVSAMEEATDIANAMHICCQHSFFLKGGKSYSIPKFYRWIENDHTFWIQPTQSRC